eukprot:m.77903 g.77903  ORF g.77903 m.77903 type:complete len:169 (-) comp8148_c0_seq2:162-668(-)
MWRQMASIVMSKKRTTLLSCCLQSPRRLRGMLVSILVRTRVMYAVTSVMWASPSCITTAASSALCEGSQAWSAASQAQVNEHQRQTRKPAAEQTDTLEGYAIPVLLDERKGAMELHVNGVVLPHLDMLILFHILAHHAQDAGLGVKLGALDGDAERCADLLRVDAAQR